MSEKRTVYKRFMDNQKGSSAHIAFIPHFKGGMYAKKYLLFALSVKFLRFKAPVYFQKLSFKALSVIDYMLYMFTFDS